MTPDFHVIVPHAFNPWFSAFILVSNKQSIIDDGIAYHYDSPLPNNLFCKVYSLLGRKLNKTTTPWTLHQTSFRDYLASSSCDAFYCIMDPAIERSKIKSVIVRPKTTPQMERKENLVVYLDTGEDVTTPEEKRSIFLFFENLVSSEAGPKFIFKAHPRSRSTLATTLSEQPWAKEIEGDFEQFAESRGPFDFYSVYSSATLTLQAIQPQATIHCFTTPTLASRVNRIHTLFQESNVQFVHLK